MSKKKSKSILLGTNGEPCPRCGLPTEIRGHREITDKHRRQPFYYLKWYNCANPQCVTTLIMPEKFKAYGQTAEAQVSQRTAAIREQLSGGDTVLGRKRHKPNGLSVRT